MKITYIDSTGNRQTYELQTMTAADRLCMLELEAVPSQDTTAEINAIRDAIADALNHDRKAALRFIKRAFAALDVLNDISHTKYFRDLVSIVREEEKRNEQPDDTLTRTERIQLFAVWRLAEYATDHAPTPHLKDYLCTRASLYQAAAIALNYGSQVRKAFLDSGLDIHIAARLDFAILNR